MSVQITDWELWRLEVPTGRMIGDSNCHYDCLHCAALCLKTNQGHAGWGYGETVYKGHFTIPAWYIKPMADLDAMKRAFNAEWWPLLAGRNPFELSQARRTHSSSLPYLDTAVHMGLWDLMAQQVELPLYRMLGGKAENNRVWSYGSLLDMPLSEEEAVNLAKNFVQRGFRAIKVKVGHESVQRDLKRLHAVRDAVGDNIQISIDANTVWTCEQAIDRIRTYQRDGLKLEYIEDPLPHEDVEGIARLNASIDIDVVGHDYINTPRQVRSLLEHKALNRLRAGSDIDYTLACADIAAEHGVPLIFGNSMFEINVHLAAALPNVDRLECSDLEWNRLMRQPVGFENGYGIAPQKPGHGLDPNPDVLKEWSQPSDS